MKHMYPDQAFYKPIPPQEQEKQPGIEHQMMPRPIYSHPLYQHQTKRLFDKVAIVTGGDSGIGRAVSLAFARNGAKVVIAYLKETADAYETKDEIDAIGGDCLLIPIDITNKDAPKIIVKQTLERFNTINILVNNHATQIVQTDITNITDEQLLHTFQTNFFSIFALTREVVPHLKAGDTIINTTSVTAYYGNKELIDYSATKGALTTFTRSLALQLAPKQIRVNAVAPGPVWTPLIPSSFSPEDVTTFGQNGPFGRPAQPVELAGAYVFLASDESSYMTGHTIHINGGVMENN